MLDSHRLAPYPELTFQFFWGGVGVGQGQEWEMRRGVGGAHRTGRKGIG